MDELEQGLENDNEMLRHSTHIQADPVYDEEMAPDESLEQSVISNRKLLLPTVEVFSGYK